MAVVLLADPDLNPDTLCVDGRFNHHTQLSSRLDYVRYVNIMCANVC